MTALGEVAESVQVRARRGASRVRDSALPIVEASIAAAVAWLIAHLAVGHPNPFFAPVAAWTCLGFTRDTQVRAVAELAVGVTIGIGLGDLVVHQIGSGAWQIAVILVVTALVARFVSPARLLAAQAGVQAIIVVALPMGGGPMGRWTDALIGGGVALAFAALLPRDTRRRPRQLARQGFGEIAAVLVTLASGLESRERELVLDALARARSSQGIVDQWAAASASSRDLLKVSPLARRRAAELEALARAERYCDRALRSTRVVVRRAAAMFDAPSREGGWGPLAEAVTAVADGAAMLADAYGTGSAPAKALPRLKAAGRLLTPELGEGGWDRHAFVLLLRSLVIDLLRAAGLTQDEARATLPRL